MHSCIMHSYVMNRAWKVADPHRLPETLAVIRFLDKKGHITIHDFQNVNCRQNDSGGTIGYCCICHSLGF